MNQMDQRQTAFHFCQRDIAYFASLLFFTKYQLHNFCSTYSNDNIQLLFLDMSLKISVLT